MGKLDLGAKLVRSIEKIAKEQKAAEKAGDIETALQKNKELRNAIQAGVNDPAMPRAKPLSDADIQAFAERMAPQVEGKLTRGKTGAKTVAGKTQKQFEREKTLPVQRRVLPGQKDPSAPLPYMTMEDQKGGVIIGLSGDPTLARTELSGIDDVLFEKPVTLEGGPRYEGDGMWASNIAGASNLIGAGKRASEQYGGAPIYAMYQKMPEGFGFAQHYLDSLLQYTRPDQLPKAAREALEDDIRKGFINAQGKRVTFPKFSGFDDLNEVSLATEANSILRKHIADRLEKSQLYGLRPAGDVQFAVTHPELTNLETGASGFKIAELPLDQQFTPSSHRTYTEDIKGTVLGQTRHPTPYDLIYRDELDLVRKNPKIAEEPFNTLKLLGPRQTIDEQLINEINEYQERMRRLIGKKKGGQVNMAGGGAISKLAKLLAELPAGSKAAQEAIAAEMAAREAAEKAAYAAHTLPSEAGKKGLSKAKEILTPDINKADGGAVDAPDWYAQLGAMLQNPEPTWYDQLGEMLMAEGGSASLKDSVSRIDLAPYGLRHSGEGAKGNGYFGPMRGREGVVTELSAEDDDGEYPLVVPTLTREELDHLLSGGEPTEMIYNKARSYAEKRKGAGKSPFADPSELRYPMPTERGYADGGQTFPLKDPEEEQRRRMMEGSDIRVPQKYPTLVKVGEGFNSAHEFISKPFGYENPPGEFVSELLGIPAVGKTLENIGYDMPLTTGAGMTSNLRPEVAEAALTALPVVGKAAQMTAKAAPKVAKKATEALAPTVADLLETQLRKSGMMMSMAPEGKAAKVKSPANDLGFYSTVEKAALNLQRKSGTGDSFLADLMKNPGVSESRLDEMGLTALRGKKNVTADEVRALASENKVPLTESKKIERNETAIEELERRNDEILYYKYEAEAAGDRRSIAEYEDELQENIAEQKRLKGSGEAKFSPTYHPDYNTPGGTDYREIRVKVPVKRLTKEEAKVVLGAKPDAKLTEADIDFASKKAEEPFMHTTHHGNEPNVLFHLRVANHADAEGKKGLLIDELQSDWHQKGKKQGYKGDTNIDSLKQEEKEIVKERGELVKEFNEHMSYANSQDITPEMQSRWNVFRAKEDALNNKMRSFEQSVPDAPFKDNWYQLGLKRAIKEATDTGMDRLYLTTGATQAERYDLSKQIGSLSIKPKPNNIVSINAYKDGEVVIMKDVPKDQLADYIGKDMAKKAINDIDAGKDVLYSDLDLKVGGEGMKQYYDKTYLNWLKKYAKEHNAEVGMTKLSGSDDPVYFLDLTPKLKETAKKGQSYKRGGSIKHHKFSKELQKYAEGGTISDYNTSPDRSDGGLMILEKNGYA